MGPLLREYTPINFINYITLTFTFTEPVKEFGAEISLADVNLGTRNCDLSQSLGGLDSEAGEKRQSVGQKQ